MPASSVQVLSIHDRCDSTLSFDLRDLLRPLQPFLDRWTWCILDLETVGGDSESVCRTVKETGDEGVWMSSAQLQQLAESITQTIDGTFMAFPRDGEQRIVNARQELWNFPAGLAELVIRAVDSSSFEVYVKDPFIAGLLSKSFHDVRFEDPALYFGERD